jgi:ATP-dependent RNA helicase RhlE
MIGCAQTGTGSCFCNSYYSSTAIRIVGSSKKASPIRALVITPTRELAVQITEF